MRETIAGVERVSDGRYKFTVVGRPEKIRLESGHTKRIWVLSWEDKNGHIQKRKFHLFASDYTPIVMVLGGTKVGGNVEWDDEQVDGKIFDCDLKTVKSKDGKYDNYKFENCEEGTLF